MADSGYGISSQGDYGYKSSSGAASGGTLAGGGTFGGIAPVVIGGYKSDGTASATNVPTLAIGAVIVVGIVLAILWHRAKK